MSSSFSNIKDPGIANATLAITTKKSNIGNLNSSLVSGKKNLSNATVAELATARQAAIKVADFQAGIKNLSKAVDVLEITESYLNHARAGLEEMKEIATNATGVMSDKTREASLVPQFQDAVSRYEAGAKTYIYDRMPLLDGNFNHQFIVSSVYGDPTMETINLKDLDFSARGLSLTDQPTDVEDINTVFVNLRQELEAVNSKIGDTTKLSAAVEDLNNYVVDLQNKIAALWQKIEDATPETRLTLGGVISDNHYNTISDLKSKWDTYKTDFDTAVGAWDLVAPGNAAPSASGEQIKNDVNGFIGSLDTLVKDSYEPVKTSFVYNTNQIVKVDTYANAMLAESTIDNALTKATNAITKVQGQQNALNRITSLSERNIILQNKVAHEYGQVDPIETNATISTNKLELERAVCALKEYQHMEQEFSRYLSQVVNSYA